MIRINTIFRILKALSSFFFILFLLESSRAYGLEEGRQVLTLPEDFPELIDQGGLGKGEVLTGFGGIASADRLTNKKAVKRRPVIFVHGNGAHALDEKWGGTHWRQFLLDNGYNAAEIWAVSYLGKDNNRVQFDNPHKSNAQDLAIFIKAVCDYLEVEKVDLVGHSLGGGLIKAALSGYDLDGTYHQEKQLFDKVGTVVALAAAFYGLGAFSIGEFKTGGPFEQGSHFLGDVLDDTPFGSSQKNAQIGDYPAVSELDNDQIFYVSINAIGDFVDAQHRNTFRLEGAHLNAGLDLGIGLAGHEKIIKDESVFALVKPFLNRKQMQD